MSFDHWPWLLQVAEYEATTFSIFYNNSLFLAIVILASFYILSVSADLTKYYEYKTLIYRDRKKGQDGIRHVYNSYKQFGISRI